MAQMDNRQILIAGVVAPLVLLVLVVAYYLLVYVPNRDAREAERADVEVTVGTDRPPGALSEGDGFRPSVIAEEPPPETSDPFEGISNDDSDDDEPVDDDPGLEKPPVRTPRPTPEANTPPPARAEHSAFVRDFLGRQSNNTVSALLGLYGPTVRYYDRGRVDASVVQSDKEAYFARFPDRRYTLAGPVRVVSSTGNGAATLRFDYTFAVGGGRGGERSGRAYYELDVVPSGDTFLIQGERGDVY